MTRKTVRAVVLALLGMILCAPRAAPAPAATTTLLGVYYGNQGWAMGDVRNMEGWQGKKDAVVTLFTNWCNQTKTMNNLFSQQLPNIWGNGNVPVLTWEPYLCTSTTTPIDIAARAAGGQYDTYLTAWATRLRAFLSGPDGVWNTADDRRVYIRLAQEMNGNWYPWSAAIGGTAPSDYVAMWRRVKGIVDRQGLDSSHVQWVWCVNNVDVGGFPAEQYYPGDAYVDWVAVDGYNWGASQTGSTWTTPVQTFAAMIGRLRVLTTKPLALSEVASTSVTPSGPSVAAKAQWITDLFTYSAANNVQMVSWFNQDKETDWAVFGGAGGDSTYTVGRTTYQVYSAYKAAVGTSALVSANRANPRLLTDAQFAGQ